MDLAYLDDNFPKKALLKRHGFCILANMRKFLFLLLSSTSLFAAPVGNPCGPGLMQSGLLIANPWIKVTTGYLADYVSNMPLKMTSGGSADFNPDESFKHFGLHSQMATFSIVLLQRLETYALLGGSKEHLKWHEEPHTPLYEALFDFQSSYHFSWAVGARVVLLQWGQTFFSIDGSYFAVPSSPKSFFKFLNRLHLPLDQEKQQFRLREWQAGAGLSSKFWIFTPYAGMKYFQAKLHVQSGPDTTALNYRNKERLGYFFGLTLSLTSKFLVTGERRLHDEFAYMFSTQAVF
jgi:hypothetical protein